jgi:hypothetical protein
MSDLFTVDGFTADNSIDAGAVTAPPVEPTTDVPDPLTNQLGDRVWLDANVNGLQDAGGVIRRLRPLCG